MKTLCCLAMQREAIGEKKWRACYASKCIKIYYITLSPTFASPAVIGQFKTNVTRTIVTNRKIITNMITMTIEIFTLVNT